MNAEEALVLLHTVLQGQRLRDVQEQVFCYAWEGWTYPAIADRLGYDTGHIRDIGSQLWQQITQATGEKVSKNNVQSVLRRQAFQKHGSTDSFAVPVCASEAWISETPASIAAVTARKTEDLTLRHQHWGKANTSWGEAIDVSVFYGRSEELARLEQWIVNDRCRLVALLGMGGIGKTALSVKLAEQLQDQFEFVIWRSLKHAPSAEALVTDLLQILAKPQEIDLLPDLDSKISQLIHCLRQHRCLLVLDNAETVLEDEQVGYHQKNHVLKTHALKTHAQKTYVQKKREHRNNEHQKSKHQKSEQDKNEHKKSDDYGELFQRIGEIRHQSCLVLTSRRKPREFGFLEGDTLPVRSLSLAGLKPAEARQIFRDKGAFSGSESEWKALTEHYAGNPQALKIVADGIQELLDGDISECLALIEQGFVFDEIRNLLEEQFNGLSDSEAEAMYWLAIERDPVSLSDLQKNLSSPVSRQKLPETLRSLKQRFLIEKTSSGFTQQPVVMEYTLKRLIGREEDMAHSWRRNSIAQMSYR